MKLTLSILVLTILAFKQLSAERFVLITSLYNETNDVRLGEYLTCLCKNIDHDLIECVHVVYDRDRDAKDPAGNLLLRFLQEKGIPVTFIFGRPTYGFCFDIANELYPDKNVILSNADIFFNETLHQLKDYDLSESFLALTRWDVTADGSLRECIGSNGKPMYNSQDVWMFKTPLRLFKKSNIEMGVLGCDGGIAYQANAVGLKVINPCLSIQCCHLHLSNLRRYNFQYVYPQANGWLDVPWTKLH